MFVEDLSAVPTERLEAQVASLHVQISAATCRWLLLVGELDRREACHGWGLRSTAEWLSWQCGIGLRAAQEQVRVGRRLPELDRIRELFGRGELSYSKVRALCRVATPENEQALVEVAREATGAQLERIARGLRTAGELPDAEAIASRRFTSWCWDDDGALYFSARLAPEEGALLLKAIQIAREELHRERDPQPRTRDVDAFCRVIERGHADSSSRQSGGDLTQIVVHVDAQPQEQSPGSRTSPIAGDMQIEDGPVLPQATGERLACDASVVTLIEEGGVPLGVGRKTRSIPPAIRRALKARDGGCRFPGCEADRFVDAHHIVHWAAGGKTELPNLVSLCRHHHKLIHEGGFGVRADGQTGFIFTRPDGRSVPEVGPRPEPERPTEVQTWNRALVLTDAELPHDESPERNANDRLLQRLGPQAPRSGYQRLDLDHTIRCLTATGPREPG